MLKLILRGTPQEDSNLLNPLLVEKSMQGTKLRSAAIGASHRYQRENEILIHQPMGETYEYSIMLPPYVAEVERIELFRNANEVTIQVEPGILENFIYYDVATTDIRPLVSPGRTCLMPHKITTSVTAWRTILTTRIGEIEFIEMWKTLGYPEVITKLDFDRLADPTIPDPIEPTPDPDPEPTPDPEPEPTPDPENPDPDETETPDPDPEETPDTEEP